MMDGQPKRRRLTEGDFERMNLPEEFWRAKVQRVSDKSKPLVFGYLKEIRSNVLRGSGLFLSGRPGVGKSSIAALVLKEARIHGFTGFFITVWELKEAIRSRLMFDATRTVLDRCRDVHVLVLDDLGKDDLKGGFGSGERFLEGLLSYRGSRKRVTVITTRLTNAQLMEEVLSLLKTMEGYLNFHDVKGPNMREAGVADGSR